MNTVCAWCGQDIESGNTLSEAMAKQLVPDTELTDLVQMLGETYNNIAMGQVARNRVRARGVPPCWYS